MTDSNRRKEIATGLFIFLILFGGFGFGEFSLRLINYFRFGAARAGAAMVDDPAGPLVVDPATQIMRPRPGFSGGNIQINELGFRSPPLEQPKPESRIRLAFVGASTTYDFYANSNETTWPHLTWRFIQDAVPGCHFDYANAGIWGLGLRQYGTAIDRYIAPITPDVIVIFGPGIGGEAARVAREKGRPSDRSSRLARISFLWQTIEANARTISRQRAALRPEGKITIDPTEFARGFEDGLEGAVRRAQSIASVVVLVGQRGHLRRHQSPQEQIAAAASQIDDLPYLTVGAMLDLREAIDAATARVAVRTGALLVPLAIPGDDIYWADSVHFREPASRLLAELLEQRLLGAEQFRTMLRQRGCDCGGFRQSLR